MLVDTKLIIAYKCPVCGSFEFFSMYLFNLIKSKKLNFECKCKCSKVQINFKLGQVYFLIPCIACDKSHLYRLSVKELLKKDCLEMKCSNTATKLCVIGYDRVVWEKIDALERELDEMIDLFGYDNYFRNTQVMFDTLNIIHDIAEKGELYCECDKTEVDVVLLPDKICVSCCNCNRYEFIYASSNEDFRHVNELKCIKLTSNYRNSKKKKNDAFQF
jgi:hypothetical protein